MIDILIVATNNYTQFLPRLIDSIKRHWKYEIAIHVFTDKTGLVRDMFPDVSIHEIPHREWPYATLYRFHFFRQYINEINGQYVFYVDADTEFKEDVKDIHSLRTAVRHCGFTNRRGSYETRTESKAYVAPNEGDAYYGGGFWGFIRSEFVRLVSTGVSMINEDRKNGITPVWHDESVLNRYLIDNPPTLVLPPDYHYPENNEHIYNLWGGKDKYKPKLLLLSKNHSEVRA